MSDAPQALGPTFEGGRRAKLSLDEQRAKALLARRLFGTDAAKPVVLDRYEVHERLGSGGLGVVYRAWDPVLERVAAVKVLRADAEGDIAASGGARVHLRESRRVAGLVHPGVVRVFASGAIPADDVVYVVMEFLPGGTLEAWLAAAPRELEEILDKFQQAASALQAAHAAGILHRDFKPANILLDGDGHVRVVDFGTHGTPGFMPPEQERGEPIDERADVYALCVSLRTAVGRRRLSWRLDEALRWGTQPLAASRCPNVEPLLRALVPKRSRAPLVVGLGLLGALGLQLATANAQESCSPPQLEHPESLADDLREHAETFVDSWNASASVFCQDAAEPQQQCLETARVHWRTVLAAIAAAPDAADAFLVLDGLPNPRSCDDGDGLDVSVQTALDTSFKSLRLEIEASQHLGTWAEHGALLLDRVRGIREAALASGNRRVEAGAALYLGVFEQRAGHADVADRLYRDAYHLAIRGEDAVMAFHAADRLSYSAAAFLGDAFAAELWMERAREAAGRREDPPAEAELLMLEGRFAGSAGSYKAAVTFYDQAEQSFSEDTSLASWEQLYSGRGDAKQALGDLEAAAEDYERVFEKLAGVSRNSLIFTHALQGLGSALLMLGRLDEAEDVQVRLRDAILAQQPDSPDLAAVRFNLSQIYSARGAHAAALRELEMVRERFEAYGGPEHPGATAARSAMAEQHEALGNTEQARREAEAALRWNVPQQYAGGAHLVLARFEISTGSKQAARDRLNALIEHPETLPEASAAAVELLQGL